MKLLESHEQSDLINRKTATLPKYDPRKKDLPKRSDYIGATAWLRAVQACIGEPMVSRIKFKRCVGVQSETIELNISERKLVPDFEMPISEHRSFKYFFRRCKRADCRIECKKTAMRIC